MKIKVTTARPSFRRAGFTFTREPQILDTKDLTKDQLDAIQSEPHLNVQVLNGNDANSAALPTRKDELLAWLKEKGDEVAEEAMTVKELTERAKKILAGGDPEKKAAE